MGDRSTPTYAPIRVVIVDDQAPFRDAARAALERAGGFEVVAEAASGEAAIVAVERHRPNVVVMDIHLGDLDGIAATREIVRAATTAHPTPLVVLVSTYALADLPPGARQCGAGAYLNKHDFGGRALRSLWDAGGDRAFC